MLTADEARQLDRLALSPSRTAPNASAIGARRARTRGVGIEFQDYRHYQPGDDPRSIDWTVEARLQQLVVRVTRGEGQLRVHLLVDVSGSMSIGFPTKLQTASKMASALGYLAIEHRDAVGIATFSERIITHLPPAAGRPQIFRIFETLHSARASGRSDVNRALIDYANGARGGGLAVVLSDFFQPAGSLEGLQYMLYRGIIPAVIQIVAAEEISPEIDDEIELHDVEEPSAPPVIVDAKAVAMYRRNMENTTAQLGEFCSRHGLPWMRIESSSSFDHQLDACVRAGLIGSLS